MLNKFFYSYLIGCLILLVLPAVASQNQGAGIDWLTYEKAMEKGKSPDKKFFLYFSSKNCGFCRKLEEQTFKNSNVIQFINTNFTPVHVSVDQSRQLAMQYRVQGVPDLRFLSPDGAVIGRAVGFLEADRMLNLLKFMQTDSYQKMSFDEFVKSQ